MAEYSNTSHKIRIFCNKAFFTVQVQAQSPIYTQKNDENDWVWFLLFNLGTFYALVCFIILALGHLKQDICSRNLYLNLQRGLLLDRLCDIVSLNKTSEIKLKLIEPNSPQEVPFQD